MAAGEAPGRGQALADGRPPRPVPALPCHCLGHLLSQPDVTGREHSQPGDQPSSPESASQRRLLRRRRAVGSPPGPASPTRSRQGLSTPGLGPATVPRALFQPSEKQPTPPSLGMVFSLRVLEMLESSQPRGPSLPDGTFPQVPTGQTPSDWATDHARPALRSGRGLPCQPRTVGSVPTPPTYPLLFGSLRVPSVSVQVTQETDFITKCASSFSKVAIATCHTNQAP